MTDVLGAILKRLDMKYPLDRDEHERLFGKLDLPKYMRWLSNNPDATGSDLVHEFKLDFRAVVGRWDAVLAYRLANEIVREFHEFGTQVSTVKRIRRLSLKR